MACSVVMPVEGVKADRCIHNILVVSPSATTVGLTQTEIITHPENLGFQISAEKVQPPSSEVKFLGVWWRGGTLCVHPKSLTSFEQIKILDRRRSYNMPLPCW